MSLLLSIVQDGEVNVNSTRVISIGRCLCSEMMNSEREEEKRNAEHEGPNSVDIV